jgi:hypothetical protein
MTEEVSGTRHGSHNAATAAGFRAKGAKRGGLSRYVVARYDIECDNKVPDRTNGPFRISVRTGRNPGRGLLFVQAIPATLPATV